MKTNNIDMPRYEPAAAKPLGRALRAAATQYLNECQTHPYADTRLWLKIVFLTLCLAACYCAVLLADSAIGFATAYVGFIMLGMVLAMNSLHDAAHNAVFKSSRLNRALRRLAALPVGIDSDYWTLRHVQCHHHFANVDGHDLDIEPNPFLRQTPFHDWAPQYRYQHLYWPIVAGLSLPYLCWYSDWIDRFGKTKLTQLGLTAAMNRPSAWALFLGSKLTHVCLVLVVPILAAQAFAWSWWAVLALYFLGQFLASMCLVALILGTHWADVSFFKPSDQSRIPHTWHEHSFHTAVDWAPQPAWLGYWLGGLNAHLTHHLFPGYSHRHYPALAQKVQAIAKLQGFNYRDLNYTELLAAQQRFLKQMGRKVA